MDELGAAGHWDTAYGRVGQSGGSCFQAEPAPSLDRMDAAKVTTGMGVIDVGGGASLLVDRLLARGFTDLTVLDVSVGALTLAKQRLGEEANLVDHDVLTWRPRRRFDVWPDRAVFHFLVSAEDRGRYLDVMAAATQPGCIAIVGTFAADGPKSCSGLPVARYAPEELSAVVGTAWRPISHAREQHRTPAGIVQPFTWVSLGRL